MTGKNIRQIVSVLFILGLFGSAYASTQNVTVSPSATSVSAGSPVVLTVTHSTSDNCQDISGVGLKIFFNSSLLTFNSFANVYPSSFPISGDIPQDDSGNEDGDGATDKFVVIGWGDTLNEWPKPDDPGTVTLVTLNFTSNAEQFGTANVNIKIDTGSLADDCSGTPYTPIDSSAVITLSDTPPPVAANAAIFPDSVFQGTTIVTLTAEADATDAGSIAAGEYSRGVSAGAEGSGTPMNAQDGSFGGTAEVLTIYIDTSGITPGTYTYWVRAQDAGGNWGNAVSASLIVKPPLDAEPTFQAANIRFSSVSDTAMVSGEMITVYDACNSGSFLPLPAEGTLNRVTVTATDPESKALFFAEQGFSFSSLFWSRIRSGYAVGPSFVYARDIMAEYQQAMTDSNGDGLYFPDEDIPIVDELIIGRGGIPMSDTPIMGTVSPKQFLETGEMQAFVTAGPVTDEGDGISTVWAVITPPCYSAESLVTDVPLTLQEPDTDIYGAVLDGFSVNGVYTISIYAKDKMGYFCTEPVETYIIKTDGSDCADPDLNRDGGIDLKDAMIALKVLAGISVIDEIPGNYADLDIDVNSDDRIGMEEVLFILQVVAELR